MQNHSPGDESQQPDPLSEDTGTENDVLKLKMMAEMGAVFGPNNGDLPPEIEQQFLQQMYAFEKSYATGSSANFAETIGQPDLPKFEFLADNPSELEVQLNMAFEFYRQHNIEVVFEHEYPHETQYRFLVEDLPFRPNHFGNAPAIKVGIIYEEYFPNHNAELEMGTRTFMNAIQSLDAEGLQGCMSPVQFLPEGPYPTQVLLDALGEKFPNISSLEPFEFVLLETSYDLHYDDAGETEMGMGYTEGLVKYVILRKSGETKPISGPFKLYFHYEMGVWSIIYINFPGIKYPALTQDS
jgi:hypothetical protein